MQASVKSAARPFAARTIVGPAESGEGITYLLEAPAIAARIVVARRTGCAKLATANVLQRARRFCADFSLFR
jgi:hypothetical protein